MVKYNIGWGLTNCCNMNCKFCYSKNTREKTNEIGLYDWVKFVDDNHENIETINYGTGENTINDDFFKLILYIRNNYPSIRQSLTTNGYLYEKVSKNKELYNIYIKCIDEVDVSLDFAIKEKHNEFRGQPKAYDWAINTLDMLKKDDKKSTIVFVGFEESMKFDNIDGLFKIANKYNSIVRLNIYRPVSEVDNINKEFLLSYKTLKKGIEYIIDNYKVLSLSDILFGNIYIENSNIVENTGIDSIRILPNGSICPSTYLISQKYRNKYDIFQKKVLETIKFEEFSSPKIPTDCDGCMIKEKCRGGVFDRRMLWYDNLEKRDPYCPFENNEDLPKKKIKLNKKERVSVHDGYLPTMFFKNE